LIAEGDYVVGQWEGGTHAGPAFKDFLLAPSQPRGPQNALHRHHERVNGKIVEEIGLDDGVTALTQLGVIKAT
jgi:hypothetical protein